MYKDAFAVYREFWCHSRVRGGAGARTDSHGRVYREAVEEGKERMFFPITEIEGNRWHQGRRKEWTTVTGRYAGGKKDPEKWGRRSGSV